MQMLVVAVGWQVYAIRRNPLDLGLVGLAEFLPLPLLALPAGQLADRLSRRLIYAISLAVQMLVALGLLAVSLSGADRLWPFFALAAGTGVVTAIGAPASRSLAPELVPIDLLASALALRSVAGQAAVVTGPAIGGLLFVLAPEVTYGTAAVLLAGSLVAASGLGLRAARSLPAGQAPGLQHLLGGIAFLRRSPIVLGAITLDLFAVLLGGAVALLPVFARDILHVGPIGLGVLRTGPAIGALLAGILIARRPLGRFAGRKLLVSVAIFGVAMVVFGLSRSLPLSLAALAVGGFVDMISVNVRATAVATRHPGRAARPGERGRDGLHQRLERAGRFRVGPRRVDLRHRPLGRRRRRAHVRARARVVPGLPGPRARRPARGHPPAAGVSVVSTQSPAAAMERIGIEPMTSALQRRRSPS